jgi:hypothetical protein
MARHSDELELDDDDLVLDDEGDDDPLPDPEDAR